MRVNADRGVLLLLALACSPVQSSIKPDGPSLPPSSAPVAISATRDPPGAEDLGLVEVHGKLPEATLTALVDEFRTRVAKMGGDYGRIESLATRHEQVTTQETYECGTTVAEDETRFVSGLTPDGMATVTPETVTVTRYVSKTCTAERQFEVATTTLVGRALRTRQVSP